MRKNSAFKSSFIYLALATAAVLSHLIPSQSFALNESPQTFTLDGQLFQAGTKIPLVDGAVKIKVQIMNPSGTCLLYEEQQTTSTLTTDGRFTIHVGSAVGSSKRTVNDAGRTMNQVFQNLSFIPANNVPGQTCAGGFYTPSPGDIRYFRITVIPSTTNSPDILTPDLAIDSIPNAVVAQSVQGLERANILQTSVSASTALTQANLEAVFTTPAYTNLQSILGGNFIKTDSSGASLPSYAADPAGVSNGDIWFDTTTNEIKYKNAAGVQTVGAAGSGISSLTVGSSLSVNGTVGGTISGAGTIDLANTGVGAGTYTKVMVDTKGRVTAGTVSLVEADIPNLTVAGKVSGNTITSGTISGSTAVNTTGNLVTTGTVSGLTVQATNLRVYNGANYIQMTAPALSGNVNLTLPADDGNSGQFLKTDGNGILSWAAATITSSDVTTALGYMPLNAAATFSGDVTGTYNATSVDKIKGKSITAATTSGQLMIYDGTAWVNSVVSGDATLAYDGVLTLNKVPVAKGGTNATSFGNNRIIASNGTGTALQDFTCSLNQVISFDASGNATCANVTSLSGAILNGGNTTGADISVGTNDNKALQFKTNNSTAMTISQSGKVGIGTTNPALSLHIVKDTSAGSSGDGIVIETTTSANIWYGPTIEGRNKLPNGNTQSEGLLLGLAGYSYAAGNGSGHAANIALVSDGVPGFMNYPGRIDFSTTPNSATNPEVRMTIRKDGNVGIGLEAPTTALHISGAFTASSMSFAPSVSPANTGRIYYDLTTNKFKVSQNGGAYTDLIATAISAVTSLGGQTGAAQTLAISVDNSVATPTITSASDAHTWKIPMASNAGTTAGLLNKTDYDSFVAKLGTATIFAGDVSGTYNSTVVQKIQGKSVTAASVSGQIMIYDGTAWTNNVMSGDATLAHNGMFTLNKVPVTKGGTNATTFGNNRIIASNGTGSALVDFTCPLNQVITFDASGNSTCANVSSLITALVNGGNTTGGTMSVGANDNHALQFKTNNTIAMTISQNGYVGIGTTTPTSPLTVYGGSVAIGDGIVSFDKAYPGQVAVGISNTTANYGNIVNMGYANSVNYANSVAIGRGNATGNADTSIAIGIGNGATRDNSVLVGYNNSVSSNGYYAMLFGRSNTTSGQNGIAIGNGNSIGADNASAFGMNISNSISDSLQIGPSNAAKMTILSTGYVGIGTAAPAGALDVRGGTVNSGNGTSINLIAQSSTAAGSNGGNVNITAGDGVNAGGAVTITGGSYGFGGPSIVVGGGQWLSNDVTITAGSNNTNGAPGAVTISTGAAANNGGGALLLTTGGGFNNKSGNIHIVPGNPGANGSGTIMLGVTPAGVARGNVGVGVSVPTAKLEVQGQVVSRVYNNAAATTFDFANGNAQYTSASCGAMTLQNMVDGGSYTIAVQGATAGTCTFTDSAGGRTFKFSPANAATTASTHTIYSMQVMGSYVYVSWISGF